MDLLLQTLENLDIAAFTLLAILSFRRWRNERDAGALWVFLTFVSLGGAAFIGLFLPEDSDWWVVEYLSKVVIAILLLFPYFLYRLSSCFMSSSRGLDAIAAAGTAAVVVWGMVLPSFPDEGEAQPASFRIFVVAVLLVWTALSLVVAIRFWRAGAREPGVASRRMRMLAVATLALSVALIVSGSAPDAGTGAEVVVQTIALLSAITFFLAFFPPSWLRSLWRRPSEEALQAAAIQLMTAENKQQVIDGFLPHAAEMVGGQGLALVAPSGQVLAAHGFEKTEGADDGPHGLGASGDQILEFEYDFGKLVVRATPFTPFFGRDEVALLGSLGALANLALERVEAADMKVELAEARVRRRQALEINDNIVQGLAVAKYAFDLGDHEKAMRAVEGTLAAARAIIGDLVEQIGVDTVFGRGSEVRGSAATGFVPPAATKDDAGNAP